MEWRNSKGWEPEPSVSSLERGRAQLQEYREKVQPVITEFKYSIYELSSTQTDALLLRLKEYRGLIVATLQEKESIAFIEAFNGMKDLLYATDYSKPEDSKERDRFKDFAIEILLELREEVSCAMRDGRVNTLSGLGAFKMIADISSDVKQKDVACGVLIEYLKEIEEDLQRSPMFSLEFFRTIFSEGNPWQINAAAQVLKKFAKTQGGEMFAQAVSRFFGDSPFGPELCAYGEEFISPVLRTYQLPESKFLKAWYASTKRERWSEMIFSNLKRLMEIEKEEPGASAFLYKEFGIMDFGRYPKETLVAQVREHDDLSKPYGVVIFPREDWNGAFYNKDILFESLTEQLKGELLLRVFECEGRIGVVKALIKADRKYHPSEGVGHKIELAIIGGHGTEDSIQFGYGKGSHLFIEDLAGHGVQKVREKFFADNPTIILSSCSTGTEGGIGQALSRILKAKVIAPKESSALQSLHASKKRGESRFRFNATFSSRQKGVFMNGEESKE
ncbi:hypothetical protein HYW18_00050 [Candidatus Uhrbacteria bacterium]|nr:hypothetical protein [Candidatus Uhrbacteria bacterium]